ncbi:MAG TPA: hypothetical protein VKI44_18515 [Acetobacteraceae bacterium]|nr:hypothetical protein [Acetobacteraceae bacterium]
MSTDLGRYHFLAWTRRGIEASLNNPDTNGTLDARASLGVQVTIAANGASAATQPSPMNVQLYGPGDVVGIDPRHVIRTEPREFTVNYEPNYLCGIEFDAPDFPWLFTPAAPNGDRLRPWLVLIVLKDDEFTPPTQAPNPLPVIQVLSTSALPDLSESWNWAHTQISGDTPLADAIAGDPGAVISRLICPRRLEPELNYTAFLVPVFDVGVQAGMGQTVPAGAQAQLAWTSRSATPLSLPFYCKFQFHTSDAGDFESLVRALTPTVMPASVGERPMDVSQPGMGIPSAGTPLGLQGALGSASLVPIPWVDPAKTAFQSGVQTFINVPAAMTDDPANPNPNDPVMAAPIYGRWLAAAQSVDRTAPGWVNELNLDPRNRAAGGMGTEVVQTESVQLMASAWQQVEGVLKANQTLKQAQLARAVLQQIHRLRLGTTQPPSLLTITAPLHARLLASPTTVLAAIRSSRVPARMLSGTFRRLTRPRVRRGASPTKRPPLLTRVNSGELSFVPPVAPPNGLVSIDPVTAQAGGQPTPTPTPHLHNWLRWLLLILIVIFVIIAIIIAGLSGGIFMAVAVLVAGLALIALVSAGLQPPIPTPPGPTLPTGMTIGSMTPATVAAIPPLPGFQITPAGTAPAAGPAPGSGPDTPAAIALRSATTDLFNYVDLLPTDPPPAPALDLAALRTTVMTCIDPFATVPRRMQSLIALSPRIAWLPLDPLEPIMAAPTFPQPMYIPLRDYSEQYVLPGAELVPANSLGLLVANHAFIEAYMTGLNHEMGRQLLWNGYPTDQRGSCFRQFWDVAAYVRQPGDPTDPAALTELLKDIPPINTWGTSTALGTHPNRTDVVANNVVLLIRGELLKRYPNAIIYAGKAKKDNSSNADPNHRILDTSDERYPIFRGTLKDDMTFLGFNLSVADAYGGTAASPEGFFFVFQQQPSEPRFGLEPNESADPTTHWADLSWTNFGTIKSGGTGIFTLPDLGNTTRGGLVRNSPWRLASQVFRLVLDGVTLPDFLSPQAQPQRTAIVSDTNNPEDADNQWGQDSAQTAYVLLRMPFRILIHADMMLPHPPPANLLGP